VEGEGQKDRGTEGGERTVKVDEKGAGQKTKQGVDMIPCMGHKKRGRAPWMAPTIEGLLPPAGWP
jgi:hypothetical protein